MTTTETERRLADARRAADAARKEYEDAVSASLALRKPLPGWREAQERAAAAAVAFGMASGKLDRAERDAGLRPPSPPPPAKGCKVVAALVRVPARAADALLFGPGRLSAWVADAFACQYESDFDADAGEPGNPWAVEVAARFGASAGDASAFECAAVAVFDADGEEVRALSAIVEGRAERFPNAGEGGKDVAHG